MSQLHQKGRGSKDSQTKKIENREDELEMSERFCFIFPSAAFVASLWICFLVAGDAAETEKVREDDADPFWRALSVLGDTLLCIGRSRER
jgi:hypothetical protein